jgi:hypothetical protein
VSYAKSTKNQAKCYHCPKWKSIQARLDPLNLHELNWILDAGQFGSPWNGIVDFNAFPIVELENQLYFRP